MNSDNKCKLLMKFERFCNVYIVHKAILLILVDDVLMNADTRIPVSKSICQINLPIWSIICNLGFSCGSCRIFIDFVKCFM